MMTDSLSCSALDELDLEQSTSSLSRTRSPSPSLRKGFRSSLPPPVSCVRFFCWPNFRCCSRNMQKILLFATLITTFFTWSGYIKLGHIRRPSVAKTVQSLDRSARHYFNFKSQSGECIDQNLTVEEDHVNPCWKTGDGHLICAPKVILVGIEGCYNMDFLSPLEYKTGLLLVNDSIHFGSRCSMEYLAKHYSQILGELLQPPEPLFLANDKRLLTSLFFQQDRDQLLSDELEKLSYWMTPTSKLVAFVCDPVSRLVQYVQQMLVLMEPTKEAVHQFVVKRLSKAQKCLKEFGAEECQKSDTKDDALYTFILQGIYYPYMVALPKYIPSSMINLIYVDQLDAATYSDTMTLLSQKLSIPVDEGRKNKCEEKRKVDASALRNMLNSMHSKTLSAVEKFYQPFHNDVKLLLRMYS